MSMRSFRNAMPDWHRTGSAVLALIVLLLTNAAAGTPISNPDVVLVDRDGGVRGFNVLANDTLPVGDTAPLHVCDFAVPLPAVQPFGTVSDVMAAAGNFSFKPAGGFNGEGALAYRADTGPDFTFPAGCIEDPTGFIPVDFVVNAPPVLDTTEIVVNLDDGAQNIEFSDLWSDADVDAGLAKFPDSLTFTLDGNTNPGAYTLASVAGNTRLRITPIASGTGFGNLTADDNRAAISGSGVFNFVSNSSQSGALPIRINTTPFLVTPVPDQTGTEDVQLDVDMSLYFDDADSGDSIDGSITANTNAALFASISFSGATLELVPTANLFGSADLTVRATDSNGKFVEDTFTVTFDPADDAPTAVDDTASTAEETAVNIDPRDNDTEVDSTGAPLAGGAGGTITITAASVVAAQGTLTFSGTSIDFTPATNFFGPATIDYTIVDGVGGNSDDGQILVTVTQVDDAPTAVDDTASAAEETAVNIDPRGNDTEVDSTGAPLAGGAGGTITITAASVAAAEGTLTFSGTSIDFTPATNFFGPATIDYTIVDGVGGNSDDGQILVTVTQVDDAPTAVDDTASTAEETAVNIDPRGNDTEVDSTGAPLAGGAGGTITITAASVAAAEGTLTFSGTSIDFTPATNFFGPATIDYTIVDGVGGNSDDGQILVTVTQVDDAPTAVDDTASTAEETAVNIDPRGNDTEVDSTGAPLAGGAGGTITITAASVAAAEGTLTFSGTSIDFTPATNFFGPATIDYTIVDGVGGNSDDGQILVTVTQVDDAPTAVDDTASTAEETAVNIDPRGNDTEVDSTGAPLAGGAGGTITITAASVAAAEGTLTFSGTSIDFTPATNFFGPATIDYTIVDGVGGNSDDGQILVTVTQVDDAPTAVDDTASTAEETAVNIDPRGNDTEVDSTGAPLAGGAGGTITITAASVVAAQGTLTFSGTSIDFTPATNFFGPATIDYTIVDGVGGNSDDGQILVTVTQVDDAPTAVDDTASTAEETAVNIDPRDNDTEVDSTGAPLAGGAGGTITITAASVVAAQGTLTFSGTSIDFTPATNFFGPATIDYTIVDGVGGNSDDGQILVTVTQVDDAPTAVDDTASTAEETAVNIDPRDNDTEVDSTGAPLAGGAGGTITITAASVVAAQGTLTFSGTSIDFTPATNFFGPATIDYTIVDGVGGNSDDGQILVTVTQVDDAPTAVDDTASTAEETAVNIDPRGNDTEVDSTGAPLAGGAGGTITITAASVVAAQGTLTFSGTSIDFTPATNFFGPATIDYTIVDGVGGNSDDGQILVTVTQVDDAPTAVDDTASTAEETAVNIDPRGNDTEVDSTGAPLAGGAGGTITITAASVAAAEGTLTFSGTSIDFTPATNFFGPATIDYTIVDGVGGNSDDGQILVTVTQVDDAPTAVDDTASTAEETAVNIDPRGNDTEVDSTGAPLAGGAGGTITITAASVVAAQGTLTFSGTSIDFTPATNFFGPATIDYTIVDGVGGNSDDGQILVTVTQVDDAPTAVDDTASTAEETAVNIDPRGNDTEVDSTGAPLAGGAGGTITITAASVVAAQGTLTFSGTSIDFTPATNFFGPATIDYTIVDGVGGNSDDGQILVTVTQVDDAPTAVDDAISIAEQATLSGFDPFGNDFEVDSVGTPQTPGSLTIQSATVDIGAVTVTGGGLTLDYTPPLNFFGTATINYVIEDGVGSLTDNANVVVTVTQVDDAPTAVDDATTIAEDTGFTGFDPIANDSEVDSTGATNSPGSITIQSASVPAAQGVVAVSGGGLTLDFTPAANFFGMATINYVIEDGVGTLTDNADVVVTVTQVDDAPTAVDDTASIAEEGALSGFDPFGNDFEVDSVGTPQTPGSLMIQSATVDVGVVTVTGGGLTLDYTPPLNFFGTATINYVIEDGVGTLTDDADVVVTSTQVDDAPTAVDDTASTAEETAVNIDPRGNDTEVDSTGAPLAGGAGGTITITAASVVAAQGTLTFSGTSIDFTPATNFFGPATIDYTIVDGVGGNSDDGQILVTVTQVDDAPTAVDDTASTAEETAVNIDPRGNDTEVDSTGAPLAGGAGGTITITAASVAAAQGTLTFSGTSIDFSPATNFFGPATIDYTIVDGVGGNSDDGQILVTVTQVDDAPTAVDDTASTAEETAVNIDPRGNDTEVDSTGASLAGGAGGTITITAASVVAAQGTLTFSGTSIDFTPATNFFGPATIDYTIVDGVGGNSDDGQILVTVTQVDDAPTAVDDTASTAEETAVNIDPRGNDTEVDSTGLPLAGGAGGTITITAASVAAAEGTLTFSGTSIDFTPATNFFGTATIDYTIIDGVGGNDDDGQILVTVTQVDDAPTAANDAATIAEDTVITGFDPFGNDFEVDSVGTPQTPGSLTIQSATADIGTVTITGGGLTLDYTPPLNFFGTATINYVIEDGVGTLTDNADLVVTVTQVDDAPTAVDDATTIAEDTGFTGFDAIGNDSEVDSTGATNSPGSITIQSASVPAAQGVVVISGGGTTLDFTPAANFFGTATINYVIEDGVGSLTDNANVVVTVTQVDDAPTAVDDATTIAEDTVITGFDPFGNDFEVDSVGTPQTPGSLTIQSATADIGTVTITGGGLTLDYTPPLNFFGTATINYVIEDGVGTLTDNADLVVTVTQVDDAPTAVDDATTIAEDTGFTGFDAIGNDSEVDSTGATNSPGSITIQSASVPAAQGVVVISGGGTTLDFTPAANFFGTATINYVIEDGVGSLTDNANVVVTVTQVDDAPTAVDDATTIAEDTVITGFDPFGNDFEVDSVGTPQTPGSLTIQSATVDIGTVTITGGGLTLDYTPPLNFFGTATINYVIEDGVGTLTDNADLVVTVTQVDDAPTAVDDATTIAEDTGFTGFDAIGNDSEVDSTGATNSPGSITIQSASVPAAQGVVVISGGGTTLDFTPAANFFGTATINYVIEDGVGSLTDNANVVVTVTQVDDAPTAVDDATTIAEDTVITGFDPFGNDFEVDSVGTPQTPGSLTIQSATVDIGTVTITGGGLALDYTPPLNFFGTATINYVIEDGVGTLTDNADLVVTVTQVDDAPTAVDDVATIDEDTLLTAYDPRGNDSEVDSTGPPQSPGTVMILSATVAAAEGTVVVSGGGTTIDYAPAYNFFGIATISYEIDDGVGPLTDTANILVTVNNVDDAPNNLGGPTPQLFGDDNITVTEDVPLTFDALANDQQFDGAAGDPIVITGLSAPGNGTVTTDGTNITYTPNPEYFGADFFMYTARDSFGPLTHDSFVLVDVTPVDDAPLLVDDVAAIDEDTALIAFDPLVNDTEFDSSASAQSPGTTRIQSATVPASVGTVTVTGGGTTIDFTPVANFFGTTTINYVADDNSGLATSNADILVTVAQVDDAPNAQDDAALTNEDTPLLAFNVLGNDTEVDSNGIAQTPGSMIITSASVDEGSVAISGGGLTLDYTPDANFFGTAVVTYEVIDDVGPLTDTANFTINVVEVNDFPLAGADLYAITEDDQEIVLNVLDNDFLFDAPVTIISAGTTQVIGGDAFVDSTETTPTTVINNTGDPETLPNGSVSIVGDTIIYEPKPNYNGSDFFFYTIEDADGETDVGRVDITIASINDPPVVPDLQSFTVVQDTLLTVNASAGVLVPAFDVDGDTITVILQVSPSNGVLILNDDGSFTYQPNLGYVGQDAFQYFVFDGTEVNEGVPKVVQIDVEPSVVVTPPPPSGTVEDVLPLAQIPLELVEGVDPNVLILMDDSGSMDFSLATNEDRAVMRLSNYGRTPRPSTRRTEAYDYLTHYPNNTYFRGGLPSEAELLGSSLFGTSGNPNEYGVWRGRTHFYNQIYYNPQVRYRPWRGLAPNGNPFPQADPGRAVLNPTRTSEGFGGGVYRGNRGWDGDLTRTWQYGSYDIPEWDNNGGDEDRTNENYYIPRYYQITEPGYDGSEPDWDTQHCLVEIRPASQGYTAKDEAAGVPICASVTNDDGGGNFSALGFYPGGPERTDCFNPASCTYTEELQNFANWFVYYRNREYTVKAALGAVVSDATGLNIGYAVINRTSERRRIRPMEASFRGTNKAALLDQIYRIQSSGGTPLRRNLDRAGRHFRCRSGDIFGSGSNTSPGNSNCPVAPAPAGLCQAQFTLLFTDGVWNSSFSGIGNEDINEATSNFDGGFHSDNQSNTLGDIAMFYYETDLHGSLANLVPTSDRDRFLAAPDAFENADNEVMHQHMTTFTVGFGVDGALSDNDIPSQLGGPPATVNWGNPFTQQQAKIDDLRHAALNGRGDYLSAADPTVLERELRDAFEEFGSGAGSASAVSFNSQQVQEDTTVFRGFYNTDDNTGDLVAQRVDFDTNTVVEPPVWSGADLLDLRTFDNRVIVTYDREPFVGTPAPKGIPFRFASMNIEQRALFTDDEVNYLRGDRSNERPLGSFRERPGTGGLLGDIVNSSPVFIGAPTFFGRDRVQFPVGSGDLYSDYVEAQENRPGRVYVGANDGLMHAFEANDPTPGDLTDYNGGREIWAYVPDRLLRVGENDANSVRALLNPSYEHLFFVDGRPAINDVFMKPRGGSDRAWRTILVGTFRAGGKGMFALDVTNPGSVVDETSAAQQVMWEFTDEDDSYPVVPTLLTSSTVGDPVDGAVDSRLDANGRPVRDLGYTFSTPTIGMTNVQGSGGSATFPQRKWAAIFGNGYNSTYGFATLFVNFIEDGNDGVWDDGDFVKLRTSFGPPPAGDPNAGLPNGLGEPRAIDLNGDGTVDYAYAGDLRGNLFRFDLTDPDPDKWRTTRIFHAKYSDGTPQPITTQPIVTLNTQADGVVILFGTGSYFTTRDGVDQEIQSVYGIWDRISAGPFAAEASPITATGDRSLLVEQELINLFDDVGSPDPDPDLNIDPRGPLRSLTANELVYDITSVRGWYIDFDPVRPTSALSGGLNPDDSGDAPPGPQFPGERGVRNLALRGGFLFLNTVIPRDNLSCDASPGGFGLAVNPLTGGLGGLNADSAFDLNNDGEFDDLDLVNGNVIAGLRFSDAVPTDSTFIGTRRFTQLSDRSLDIRETNTGFGSRTGRLSWRELE